MKYEKIKKVLKKNIVPLFEALCKISKNLSALAYRGLFLFEWFIDNPENFDHEIDLYYQWSKNGMPYWLERGVYSVQALKMFKRPIVVELCCGDGFNAKYFYSTSASKIYACDFDANIIKIAQTKNQKKNIIFRVADIRKGIKRIFKEISGGGLQILFGMQQ